MLDRARAIARLEATRRWRRWSLATSRRGPAPTTGASAAAARSTLLLEPLPVVRLRRGLRCRPRRPRAGPAPVAPRPRPAPRRLARATPGRRRGYPSLADAEAAVHLHHAPLPGAGARAGATRHPPAGDDPRPRRGLRGVRRGAAHRLATSARSASSARPRSGPQVRQGAAVEGHPEPGRRVTARSATRGPGKEPAVIALAVAPSLVASSPPTRQSAGDDLSVRGSSTPGRPVHRRPPAPSDTARWR